MSTSTANVNPQLIPLSPMRVKYKGIDLGGTTNDVTMGIKYDTADIMVDQFGKSIVDKVVSGLAFNIKFTLAEVKNKDNWKVAFPSIHEIVNGGVKSVYADMQIGDHLYAKAGELLLHPLENADGDLSEDYLFFKASCIDASEVKYSPTKQTGLAVEFIVFPDIGVNPARYMVHGDPSNGMTNAQAAAAVAGSNTGNGTISAEAAFNGVTKTEVITFLCLDAVAGNNFVVTGSLSGALGYVHVGATSGNTANFVPTSGSPQVLTCTLNQGSTQFVPGDSFTIATTASNFS